MMKKREIDCEQALRQVFDYIDRELSDHDRHAMEHHLHRCKSCFSRVEFERRLKQKLGELREHEDSPRLGNRINDLLKGFE